MKIDIFDGSISFETGMIERFEDRSIFLSGPLGRSAKEELVNPDGDWRHVTVTPGYGVTATLVYQGERLHQVYVALAMPGDQNNEWSVTSELERKVKHDTWLRAELGEPPYKYAWGDVVSDFDEKGLASDIIITYAR